MSHLLHAVHSQLAGADVVGGPRPGSFKVVPPDRGPRSCTLPTLSSALRPWCTAQTEESASSRRSARWSTVPEAHDSAGCTWVRFRW